MSSILEGRVEQVRTGPRLGSSSPKRRVSFWLDHFPGGRSYGWSQELRPDVIEPFYIATILTMPKYIAPICSEIVGM